METLRALIAEDDDTARVLHCRTLEQLFGGRVVIDAAANAEEALALLRQRSYHLALVDYRMGWMTGIDLLEIMHREAPECLRILITGHAELTLAQEAIERAKVHGFFTKPLDGQKLAAMLRTALGPRA